MADIYTQSRVTTPVECDEISGFQIPEGLARSSLIARSDS